MQVIHTEIDIEAKDAAERAWRTLVDFPSYPEWNPFIRKIEGEARVGARLLVELRPPGRKSMSFRPTLIRVEPGLELRWRGRLIVPGLFSGEHILLVEPFRPDRARFFQREIFRGALVGMMKKTLEDARAGFEEMNRALKERIESR